MNPLRSVSAKLSLVASLLVLAVIGLMARRLIEKTEEGFINEMRVRAQFFARSAQEPLMAEDQEKIDLLQLNFHVVQFKRIKAVVYVGVLSADGKLRSHSDWGQDDPGGALKERSDPKRLEAMLKRPSLAGAKSYDDWLLEKQPGPQGVSYEVWQPIFLGPRRLGTVLVGFNESSVAEAIAGTKREIAVVAAGATAGAILGMLMIVGWITRPLPLLAAAAREIARGNFKVEVKWKSRDEVGLLARAFNEMAAANALMFAAIRQEKERIERIFNSTREGMILAGADGRVHLMNPAAARLLGFPDKPPETAAEAFARFAIEPDLAAIMGAAQRAVSCEMRREHPKLLVLSARVDRLGETNEPAGFLFLFYDATVEKREEILERNFLSLVSHKLRTPLAVSLGNLELMGMDTQNLNDFQKKALGKVQGENEKLRSLVEKLIMFTTVQSPETLSLDPRPLSLAEAVAGALKAHADLLAAEGASVEQDPEALKALPPVTADARYLIEVLKNLIENAVKFNPKRPKSVRIQAAESGGSLRVAVIDNGPGIPSEELGKLFTKFYQVDSDFTGQVPGFGLGLAFVKDVIRAHGGDVGVRSEPGKGSEFYFTLPRK